MEQKSRIYWIDGLKGLCSVWVVIFHYLLAFKPDGFIGWNCIPTESEKAAYYFEHFPYSLLTNGPFVLYTFLALIAFIPAYQYLCNRDKSKIQYQAKVRYFRLVPATLILCLLSVVFSLLNLYTANATGAEIGNPWLSCVVPEMTLLGGLYEGLIGAFVNGTQYLMVLWCMHYIFLGSYFAYAIILMFGDCKNRAPLYAGLLIFGVLVPWTVAFTAGIAAADLLAHKRQWRKDGLIGAGLILLGLVIGKFPPVILPTRLSADAMNGIGNFFFIVGIGMSAKITSFLEKKPFLVLGKYSFSLMLAHSFVLLTGSTLMFLSLRNAGIADGWNLLLCTLAGLPACAIAAFAVEKVIGGITVLLNKKLFPRKAAPPANQQ